MAVWPTGTAISLGPVGVWICCICILPCGVMILTCGWAVMTLGVPAAGAGAAAATGVAVAEGVCCSKMVPVAGEAA